MRISLLTLFVVLTNLLAFAQPDSQKINTAENTPFLKQSEREMISEINFVRAYPRAYLEFILPYLEKAREEFKLHGKVPTSFSLRKSYKADDTGKKIAVTDTIWHNQYQEELKAVSTLVRKLQTMRPVSILEPHEGIYKAASKHGKELGKNNWVLTHRGADGSWPAERITNYASEMVTGKENLISEGPDAAAREIVILLLIDAGVKGYGHRANILNPAWTHIACYYGGLYDNKHQWVQNFGKNNSPNKKTAGLP